jgi:hypothetical protein
MSTQASDTPRRAPPAAPAVQEVVGPPFSAREAGAALAMGVVSLLLAGAMPVLLGALAGDRRLAVASIGDAAMAEALVMGLVTALCSALLRPRRLRMAGLAASLALAAIDLAMLGAGGPGVLLLRALAGAAEGVLLWITIGMIARTATPERWAGVFYTVLTLGQFILAVVLTGLVMPRWGVNGCFVLVAGLVAASAVIALFSRDEYAALPDGAAGAGLPPARGLIALAGTLLFAAAFQALIVYAVPLALQARLSPAIAGIAVTASLAAQIVGGGLAAALAGRIHHFTVFVLAALGALVCWSIYLFWPPAWLFVAASMAAGLIYMLATPFLVPMTIEADPSRRSAMQSGGVQLFGGALGPFLASRVVDGGAVHAVVMLGSWLLLGGLMIFGVLHLTTRRAV